MRCQRACVPVRVSLLLSLLGLVCLSWHVYIWQRKTQETSLFNYWWIFCLFFTSTCSVFLLFFLATRENNNKRTLKHFDLFMKDCHDFPFFLPRVFVLIRTLLLFGETCQLSEPSLVHLKFKLTLHFFSLYYLSCANTHCFSPFLLSFVNWNRWVLELTVIYI